MKLPIRLRAVPEPDGTSVRFQVEFADGGDQQPAGGCAAASLETGDGQSVDLGVLCAPTPVTWRMQRTQDLVTHTYAGAGVYEARLRWGEVTAVVSVEPGRPLEEPSPSRPELPLFALQHLKQQPLQVIVNLQVQGLEAGQELRIDGGAGEALWLSGEDGSEQSAEATWDYGKPGTYQVGVDLLDADGFWAATLAESPLEITVPVKEPVPSEEPDEDMLEIGPFVAPPEVREAAADPWLPFGYARPMWSGVLTYTAPGGGAVSRSLGWGTYVSIKAQASANGALWYRTGGGDWVAASSVALMTPSDLRGVELEGGLPPQPPAPEPSPEPPPSPSDPIGHGVVTAAVLNVRARPGVRADNPPVSRLRRGDEVDIYEEATVDGAVWYRIDVDRWVHSGWVDQEAEPEPPQPSPSPTEPIGKGVVTATRLNVRARPGVRPDNPPVSQLTAGTQVDIYEEATVDGAVWYRIGVERWTHSAWVDRIGEPEPPAPPSPPSDDAIARGVVTASLLNVRARPGVRADNPPVGQLWSGTDVDVYDQQEYDGATWYRIGADRWVHSGWVRILEWLAKSAGAAEPVVAVAAEAISLPVGWVVSQSLNVRSKPSMGPDNPPVDTVYHNQLLRILESRWAEGAEWYRIGEDRWVHGSYVAAAIQRQRPSSIGPSERWVAVNLKEQTAVAYEGDQPVFAAMAATGLPGTPTVQGIFRTWRRLDSGRMAGPGYYIEDVTWTCYFYGGYALHTAYWHDAFGSPRSHGCVNLSPYDAWWIYRWSEPGGPNSPAVYVYWA